MALSRYNSLSKALEFRQRGYHHAPIIPEESKYPGEKQASSRETGTFEVNQQAHWCALDFQSDESGKCFPDSGIWQTK